MQPFGFIDERGYIGRRYADIAGNISGAGITRGNEKFVDTRATGYLPRQCMLTCPVADNQYLQIGISAMILSGYLFDYLALLVLSFSAVLFCRLEFGFVCHLSLP